jgi:hypothetical protein
LLVIAEPVTEIETEDVVIGTETVEGVTGVMQVDEVEVRVVSVAEIEVEIEGETVGETVGVEGRDAVTLQAAEHPID